MVPLELWHILSVLGVLVFRSISQHQFWVPHEIEEEIENKELSSQVKSRYITFAGQFQPVEHMCKAPMPNGSLCERQDRVKVSMRRGLAIQFHGHFWRQSMQVLISFFQVSVPRLNNSSG